MDANLRLAWTQIVTSEDYEEHMAGIGQAEAAAALSAEMIRDSDLRPGARLIIVGAGTGQMFDFLDAALFRPFKLTCTDLNPNFLARLRQRLLSYGLSAHIVVDDIEHTALVGRADFLLAVLLFEQIDWRKGVEAITALRPAACGIVIQENPPGMATAVTPGRRIPASMAAGVRMAQPKLVPNNELVRFFEARGYHSTVNYARDVADGKRLLATMFVSQS